MNHSQSPDGRTSHHHAATAPPPRKNAVARRTEFSHPPSSEDWAKVQDLIYRLYVLQKQPLLRVRGALREQGFKATDRMIKARLKQWAYMKNAKKNDWGILAVLHHNRIQKGKSSTVFEIHGHRKTVKDLQRFIRNQAISHEDFLATHIEAKHEVPDHIRALTPEEDDKDLAPSVQDSPSDPWSPSPTPTPTAKQETFAHPVFTTDSSPDQILSYKSATTYAKPYCQQDNYSKTPLQVAFPPPGSLKRKLHKDPGPRLSRNEECDHEKTELLEVYSNQILHPSPMPSDVASRELRSWTLITPRNESPGAEPMFDMQYTCSRCNQPSHQHFPSLDNLETHKDTSRWVVDNVKRNEKDEFWHLPISTREEGSWIWVSRCFLACMCLSRGDEQLGQAAISDAANNFERLLLKEDPLLLTAALLMITILHTHDQDNISFRILNSAKSVADRLLPKEDPIRTTMAYFTASANINIPASGITIADLESAYLKLRNTYGEQHPYAITAHHNYGFMLRHENFLHLAELHLRETYQSSLKYFGKHHMQTVTSLSVLAGCFRPQPNRLPECIHLYQTVVPIATEILGAQHPYVLRLMWELATQLKKVKDDSAAREKYINLYKKVLWGRATMLGRSHPHTIPARTDYETALKETRRWTNSDGSPSLEQLEIKEMFLHGPNSLDTWVVVDKNHDVTMLDTVDVDVHLNREGFEDRMRLWERSRSSTRTPSPTTSNDFAGY